RDHPAPLREPAAAGGDPHRRGKLPARLGCPAGAHGRAAGRGGGAPMTTASRAELIEVEDDPEEVFRPLYEPGATDGAPVIPPTPARVARMLASVRRAPAEVVAVLAPRDTPATLEALAINAVMAGCLPEYFPVLVAAVEAIGQPEFGLGAVSTTTCGTALF